MTSKRLIVPGAGHDASQIYEDAGLELMRFHEAAFIGATRE